MSLILYAAWSADHADTMDVVPEGPAAVSPVISKVHTSLMPDRRLEVKVESSAEIRLVVDKLPVRMKIDRTQSYWTPGPSSLSGALVTVAQ